MDELLLHRYLDGRLDERERAAVEAALRSDPAARRTLEALREEARLIGSAMEIQVEPPSGAGRIGARVVATLHLEERSRVTSMRTRTFFKRTIWAASFAAALALCFLLVRPRTPAGSLLSGTHASVTVHGEKRDALKGAHIYDGDGLSTDKGQFVRVSLLNAQTIDVDEFTDLSIEKSGSAPVLRMTRGRIGVAVNENQNALKLEVPQGVITVHPGARVDIWLPETDESHAARWPDIFFGPQPVAKSSAAQPAPAIVTVFAGYAQLVCDKNATTLTAQKGIRAHFTATSIAPRWVNMAGSRVLDVRGDDGLHTRDGVTPVEWTLLGVMEKPQFAALGHRWGMINSEGTGDTRIADALQQLDLAMHVQTDAARAEKLAEGLQAFRQAYETLEQNDARRRIALTLEGLAHFEQGCARSAAGGRKDSDPQVSFEAARVAFDTALAPPSNQTGVPAPSAAPDWRTAFSASGAAPGFSSLPPESQAALTATFRRAAALLWSARVMYPEITLDSEEATIQEGERRKTASAASEAFALLHDELGHTVESLAALLGEALCDARAGDDAARRKALDALHVLVSKPVAGTDGTARQAFEGVRQAALLELVSLNARGMEARKTLDAAHDFELMAPLGMQSAQATTMRSLLLKGLEAQKTAALTAKRYDNAVEACDALLIARDEADGHWLDAGQIDAMTDIRHIGDRLDRLEALTGAKDWVRAAAEAHALKGHLPMDLQPRFKSLDAIIRSAP